MSRTSYDRYTISSLSELVDLLVCSRYLTVFSPEGRLYQVGEQRLLLYLLISLTYRGRVCVQSNIWLWAYRHLRAWEGHCCRYYPEEGARKCLLHKSPLQSLRVL